jgi:ElaB/YqjD/DUF883 family membrane-anchored ribosome-binding protein
MTTSTKSLRSTTPDDALRASENALDSTRQLAAQALEMASERVRDMRVGARDLASRSLGTVSDSAAAAQRHLGRYADATGRYVSQQPVRSALIAAAVGALIAGALIAARRRNRRSF